MEIISRKDAKAAGLTHYFTKKPCKYGHIDERMCSNGRCRTCLHAYTSKWVKNNRNKVNSRFARSKRAWLSRCYSNARCRVTGIGPPKTNSIYKGLNIMSRDEFLAWAMADPALSRIWGAWAKSGYISKLAPSIDRIDTQRGYVAGNVQFLTRSENSSKACLWRWQAINTITKAA